MPACDFTLWIRDRLLEGDFDSVRCLMSYIGPNSELWYRQMETFFSWEIPGHEGVLEAELRAVMLLCYRYAWAHDFRHLAHDWPRLCRVVLAVGNKENEWCVRIAAVPPTTRLVVCDSMCRGAKEGLLRIPWDLFYGDRCYGNNAAWNRSFADWLGCYDLPTSATPFPASMVNMDDLRSLAAECGITLTAKKKSALMAEAATHEELMLKLWQTKGIEIRRWASRCEADVCNWIKHAEELLPAAQALVLEAAQSLMWHDHPQCRRIRPKAELSFEENWKALYETHFGMAVARRNYEQARRYEEDARTPRNDGLKRDVAMGMLNKLKQHEADHGVLTLDVIIGNPPPPPKR